MGEKMYADMQAAQGAEAAAAGAAAAGAAGAGASAGGASQQQDDVVDAEFKEVKKD
jgi:molecular chaperone DnaK